MADSSNKATTQSDETSQLMKTLLGQDEIALARGQQGIEKGKLQLAQQQMKIQEQQFKIQAEQEKNRLQSQEGIAKDQMAAQMMQTAVEREQMDNWDRRKGERELYTFHRTLTAQQEKQRLDRKNFLEDRADQRRWQISLNEIQKKESKEQSYLTHRFQARLAQQGEAANSIVESITDYADDYARNATEERALEGESAAAIGALVGDNLMNWTQITKPVNEFFGGFPIPSHSKHHPATNRASAFDAMVVSGLLSTDENGNPVADYNRMAEFVEESDKELGILGILKPGNRQDYLRREGMEREPGLYGSFDGLNSLPRSRAQAMDKDLARIAVNTQILRGFTDGRYTGLGLNSEDRANMRAVMKMFDDHAAGRMTEDQIKEALTDPQFREPVRVYGILSRSWAEAARVVLEGNVPQGVGADEFRKAQKKMPEHVREAFETSLENGIVSVEESLDVMHKSGIITSSGESESVIEGALDVVKDSVRSGDFDLDEVLASPSMKKLATYHPEMYRKVVKGLEELGSMGTYTDMVDELYGDMEDDGPDMNTLREEFGL